MYVLSITSLCLSCFFSNSISRYSINALVFELLIPCVIRQVVIATIPVMIDDIRYKRIISYATELDLIIVTHAGIDIGIPEPVHCPPDKMKQVLREVKPEKMVLAHYGGWKQWEEVYEYIAGEDVYLDTAFTFDYIEDELFFKILQKHGSDKILFATDSPWSNVAKGIKKVRELPVDEDIKSEILYENAAKHLQN